MHEGLAEYTGFRLSARDSAELVVRLTKEMEQSMSRPSFVGSFAYSSGPAYGVLLDTARPDWLKGLTPQQDMGEMLRQALKITLPSDIKARAERQAARYDGEAVKRAETERETLRQKRITEYRQDYPGNRFSPDGRECAAPSRRRLDITIDFWLDNRSRTAQRRLNSEKERIS
jgi:hypothetical protein